MTLPILLVALLILFLVIALFGGFFTYVYWWLIQRPLPQRQGSLHVDGLSAPVEVIRDKHGIPHIYAATAADLWIAQGFVHAQDRLWQMEQQRRIANGTLAERFGKAALDVDRFSRVIGFRRSAAAEWETLDADARAALEQYVHGVNAYIASRPGQLSAEFNLLRRPPAPWTPIDVLAFGKYIGWTLCINWESELLRLQLAGQMDPFRAADLEPNYPADNPIIAEGVGSQDAMRLVETAGLLLNEYDKIKTWTGPQGALLGSNSWVLGPQKTLTERPILCNDPHLTLTIPGIWYENRLTCPEFSVAGASFAGAPGVVIGHNERITWGLTNALPDVQDLFIERPHPDNAPGNGGPGNGAPGDSAPRYEANGAWTEATVLHESIVIRNSDPHVEEVIVTRHGPLISGLIGDKATLPLSLRWTGHDPGNIVHAVLRLNRAANWDEFNAALDHWSLPPQNVTYADVDGNIGYRLAGRIPVRAAGLGLTPAPGWNDDYAWTGEIPAAELPRIFNPPSGMIVTANNKIVGDDYPYFLGAEFLPGWRARRIEEMLKTKKRLGPRDMQRIQLDTTSLYAEALTPFLTQQESDDPYVKIAINMLRNWSYAMEADSGAALVFQYTKLHLLEMVFGDKAFAGKALAGKGGELFKRYKGETISPFFVANGFSLRAETRLLELLRSEEESAWYTDAATGRPRSRDELVMEALTRSVKRIRREVNATPRQWAWGRMHQIRYIHPMGSVRLLSGYFNRGPFPIGGDSTTPNQTSFAPELPPGLVQIVAAYRQIIEVGDWDAMQSITVTGQSGHALSDNYVDQLPMWLEGMYHAMPWSRERVEEVAVHRLELMP
jgi:penicillin amidase